MFSLEHVESKLSPIQIELKFSGYPEIDNLTFFSGIAFYVKFILNCTSNKFDVMTIADPSF